MSTQEKLTVLHVSTEKGWRGGEQQVKLVTDGLAARGHRCYVFCPPDSALYADRSRAGMAEPLKFRGELDFFAASRLAAFAGENNVQLLHAQTSHAHSLCAMAASKIGVPCVVSRRVDFKPGGNFISRRKYQAPNVYYIAISLAVKQVLIDSGIAADRICVVHSGIDPQRFQQRAARDNHAAQAYGADESTPLILNVAALVDHKDQATLLRAAALLREKLPRFRLVIAGSGELEQLLKALARELHLGEHVVFAGHVADLAPLYRAADLFVMSSHLEGLCTSILDAMATGIPVAATRAGGIPEIVRDGETGLLSSVRDPHALAQNILTLLQDHTLADTMVRIAHSMIQAQFTADAMVEGTIAAYGKILAAHGTSVAGDHPLRK